MELKRRFTNDLTKEVIESFEPPATKKQIKFIEDLATQLHMNERKKLTEIKNITNQDVKVLDELTIKEASLVINKFKEWKEIHDQD